MAREQAGPDNVDSSLNEQARYCDCVIVSEGEHITRNQRLLLECESVRVKDKRQKQAQRQRIHAAVVREVLALTRTSMEEQLITMTPVQLFGRFPDFSYFADTAYSSSLGISKLSVLTTNDAMLKSEVLSIVGNAQFLERLHREPKRVCVSDPNVAIGTLGIDNCERLFSILISKALVKWQEPAIKNIVPKLWQYMMVIANANANANATCQRLDVAGWRYPQQGLLLEGLHALGMFAVVNQYPRFFEEALINKMQAYREQQRRDEYYACAEVSLDMSLLPELLMSLSKPLTQNIIEALSWSASSQPLRLALEEDINQVPVLERSLFGVALAQGSAFSTYDALERS
ncbi:hypothetical protein ATG66_0566 [Vibrio sp. ES.051]|uniref:hypothetical protein n=1 Tax=Vibrio sp. ES.051 TaxID=1761909 RepID=UPI000C017EDC|nr:hypothetical protein [Vibrio sp. ES.051]PFG58046.1 hypothetical protein ATG66_0566 [Vibrio sp. ES.051]